MRGHIAIDGSVKDALQRFIEEQKKEHGEDAEFKSMKAFVDKAVSQHLERHGFKINGGD